jgi:anthranilate phosphoribosyltransferase
MKKRQIDLSETLDAIRIQVAEITREVGFAIMNVEEAAMHSDHVAQQAENLGFAADAAHNAQDAMARLEDLIDRKAAKAEALTRKARARKGGK